MVQPTYPDQNAEAIYGINKELLAGAIFRVRAYDFQSHKRAPAGLWILHSGLCIYEHWKGV